MGGATRCPPDRQGGSVRMLRKAWQTLDVEASPQGIRRTSCAKRADDAHHRQARDASQASVSARKTLVERIRADASWPLANGAYAAHSTLLCDMRYLSQCHAFPASNLRKQSDNGGSLRPSPALRIEGVTDRAVCSYLGALSALKRRCKDTCAAGSSPFTPPTCRGRCRRQRMKTLALTLYGRGNLSACRNRRWPPGHRWRPPAPSG